MVEIHRVPVISTGHLTYAVAQQLTRQGDDNPWCCCARWDYGYFLYLNDLESAPETPPQCLLDIRNWLQSMEQQGLVDNCHWVRLDRDADAADTLPYYDW